MRTLALVPARAGSKGIPHKNTREFKGLPLLAHAIKVGQATCDQTVVSTEDMETACLAASYGATVQMRPVELAQDNTPMLPVIQHALAHLPDKPKTVVLLQPSSPSRRRAEHVRNGFKLMVDQWADSVVSVCPIPEHFRPEFACRIEGGGLRIGSPPTRRQDAKPAYYRDGTFYMWRLEGVRFTEDIYGQWCVPYIMDPAESATLDTEEDWALAEAKHG